MSISTAATLIVRNTGPNVPEDRIGELFEPFHRMHATRSGLAGGTGLGLSIVTSIAEAHDAHITARPNPGGGLELTVQFPVPTGRPASYPEPVRTAHN